MGSTAVPLTTTTTTMREALNACDPNTLADQLRALELGTFLRGQAPQQLRRMLPVTDPLSPSGTAVQTIKLAGHGKASRVIRAYCRLGGAGIPGELVADTGAYAAPASTHIAVQPNGDIAVLTADAITDVDVEYIPERGDVVVLPALPLVSNALVLPLTNADIARGVVLLISATGIVGGVPTNLRINKPAATNAANGTASLDLAKANVLFSTGGDAFTSGQVTLLVCALNDLATILSSQQLSP